jgi:hypothetical protein
VVKSKQGSQVREEGEEDIIGEFNFIKNKLVEAENYI